MKLELTRVEVEAAVADVGWREARERIAVFDLCHDWLVMKAEINHLEEQLDINTPYEALQELQEQLAEAKVEIARLIAALAKAPCQNPRHLYGTGVLGERVGDGYSAACGACASCKARARMKEEK